MPAGKNPCFVIFVRFKVAVAPATNVPIAAPFLPIEVHGLAKIAIADPPKCHLALPPGRPKELSIESNPGPCASPLAR